MRVGATQRNARSAALLSISMRPSSQERHVTADDVAANKPAPDGYVAAAKEFELAPERCLVVENSPQGVHAGRAAGMDVVAILRSPAPPRHCRSTPREECGSNAPMVARLGCRYGMRSHRRAMIRGANLREASFDRGALLRCQHRHDALAQGFYLRTRRARSRCERTAELLADFTNLQMLCARHVCRPHRSSDRRAMVSAMVTGGSLRGIGDADTGKCNTGDDSGAECASGR